MKRCPKCGKQYPDDANFCPADAGQLEVVSDAAPVAAAPMVDTAGHEVLGGRFALGEPIGGGRTGVVHHAADKQGGSCVVKLVDGNVFPTALLLQRTERELKQLERCQSPRVARVIAHGKRKDTLWIASERVEGVPLSKLVADSGALPEARVIAILQQIGEGLEEAARLGVIHRDLAPKNVLVGAGDQVKLINFGVPTPGSAEAGGGRVQGVPEFVAPEQVEGKPVDQRCNLYSLGAIAYFALTGAPPFGGDPATVFSAHANTPPAPPSTLAPVSPALEQVVLKALEKSSSKRYMTLRQLLGELSAASESPGGQAAASTAPLGMAGAEAQAAASADVAKTLIGMSAPPAGVIAAAAAANGRPPDPEEAPTIAEPPREVLTEVAAPAAAPPPAAAPVAQAAQPPVAAQPVAAAQPPPQAAKPAAGGKAGKKARQPSESGRSTKGKFRETMWFKKGELDEAAAAAAAAQKDDLASDRADELAIDERYKDDGSLSAQDHERLSLRTGATMMMESVRDVGPAGRRGEVSEKDLVSELRGGRTKLIAAVVVALGVVIALIVALS